MQASSAEISIKHMAQLYLYFNNLKGLFNLGIDLKFKKNKNIHLLFVLGLFKLNLRSSPIIFIVAI